MMVRSFCKAGSPAVFLTPHLISTGSGVVQRLKTFCTCPPYPAPPFPAQVVERQAKKAALAHEQEALYELRQAQSLGRAALAEQMDARLAGDGGGDALLRGMLQQVRWLCVCGRGPQAAEQLVLRQQVLSAASSYDKHSMTGCPFQHASNSQSQ
jgi:hypothetical protein